MEVCLESIYEEEPKANEMETIQETEDDMRDSEVSAHWGLQKKSDDFNAESFQTATTRNETNGKATLTK